MTAAVRVSFHAGMVTKATRAVVVGAVLAVLLSAKTAGKPIQHALRRPHFRAQNMYKNTRTKRVPHFVNVSALQKGDS